MVLSGPTFTRGGCDTRVPIEQMFVRVLRADGLGGFRTGLPPLLPIPILFDLTD